MSLRRGLMASMSLSTVEAGGLPDENLHVPSPFFLRRESAPLGKPHPMTTISAITIHHHLSNHHPPPPQQSPSTTTIITPCKCNRCNKTCVYTKPSKSVSHVPL